MSEHEDISFREALERLVNAHSRENGSNTPDFILADYLCTCLAAFDVATRQREQWRCGHDDKVKLDLVVASETKLKAVCEDVTEKHVAAAEAISSPASVPWARGPTAKGRRSVAEVVQEMATMTEDDREKRRIRADRVTAGAAAVLAGEIERVKRDTKNDYTEADGIKWAIGIGESFADMLENQEES
jgi:hypothetical protein